MAILGTLGPGFADRVLEIDIHDASMVILAPAVLGIILGSLWVGTFGLRFNSKRLISTGVFSGGVFLILISLLLRVDSTPALNWMFNQSVIIPLALLLFFLLGVSNSFLDVPANSTLQREADGDMRGRIYGILTAAVGGIGVLPVVAGGILADVLGVGRVLFLLGLVILLYGVFRLRTSSEA
jgi:MFS family permease